MSSGLPVFSFLLCVTYPILKAASPVFPHSSSGTQPSTVSAGFQFDVFASCASLCNLPGSLNLVSSTARLKSTGQFVGQSWSSGDRDWS